MTEQYIQKVEVGLPRGARKKQIGGLVVSLASLGFIALSIFLSLYFLIAFFVFFAVGMTLLQMFGNSAKEYEYDFNCTRLVVSKTNLFGKKKRIAEVAFKSAKSFKLFSEVANQNDILACENLQDAGMYIVEFESDNKVSKLIFAPDDYMIALITDRLK
ncbi:MAG: hypothetical protein RSB59_03745 [Clostridia bacterium]